MRRLFPAILLLLCSRSLLAGFAVTATQTELLFRFDSADTNRAIVELAPYQTADAAKNLTPLPVAGRRTLSIPRFDGPRDRIYSGFVTAKNGIATSAVRFVELHKSISKHHDGYPRTASKKGLQVQMVDDAIALGVHHAGLNIDLGSSVKLTPAGDDFRWSTDGRAFWFSRGYIESMDHQIKPLSDSGATVTLILLDYARHDSPASRILLHPGYDTNCPGHISEFNTGTPEGLAWFKAWVEFLADRYSAPGFPNGHVVNYIVGNEVNAHWDWANMGRVSMAQFTPDYARAARICAMAVRKESSAGRVFISLEHDWNHLYAEPNALQGFPARQFIDLFNQLVQSGGDFDWNLAFHPYPEDLFNCRTWEDKSATPSENTPRMTFKNIDVLARYFRRKELLFRGTPRHIILSEQGFHAKPTREGELEQAAAYCYAWRKIVDLKGIDAFILHRHVDNAAEGGLNLGLWRRATNSISEPSSKRPIYNVFMQADTRLWQQAFQFALPIIGIKSWNDIDHAANHGTVMQ